MSRSTNIFIYLGSGEEGEEMEKIIRTGAKACGFVNKKGDPLLSPFVVHCIRKTLGLKESDKIS